MLLSCESDLSYSIFQQLTYKPYECTYLGKHKWETFLCAVMCDSTTYFLELSIPKVHKRYWCKQPFILTSFYHCNDNFLVSNLSYIYIAIIVSCLGRRHKIADQLHISVMLSSFIDYFFLFDLAICIRITLQPVLMI